MIALGSDHGGLALKRHVMEYLDARGLEYQDFGCYTAESCDYPDFGRAGCGGGGLWRVRPGYRYLHHWHRHLHLCQQGEGHPLRLCSEPLSAEMTRRHNDANMLAMGGGLIGNNMADCIVDAFLNTPV